MNNTPKISVIVPVYKAEAYLERCIDSILAQTFKEFEVLLIDDGSPDNSGKICDEYAVKDIRVRVFHKENGGVSSARQCGVENSLGEYTIHVDPDDWVESNMLEALYIKAKETDADMVICDYYINYEKKGIQEYRDQKPKSLDSDTIISELFQKLHGSCCNKLVKRVCYNNYNVKFPSEFSFSEDLYVNVSLLKNNLNVSYLPKAFYHYVNDINDNSLCRSYTKKILLEDLQMKSMFVDLFDKSKHKEECENRLAYIIVSRAYNSRSLTSYEFKKNFYDCKKPVLKYKSGRRVNKILYYLSCIGFYRFSLNMLDFFSRLKKAEFPS